MNENAELDALRGKVRGWAMSLPEAPQWRWLREEMLAAIIPASDLCATCGETLYDDEEVVCWACAGEREIAKSGSPNGCKLSDDCWRGQVMQTEPASPPVGVRSSAGLGAAAGAGSASVGQLVVNDPEEGAKFDVLKGAKAGQIPANFREGGDSDGAEADSQAAVYVSRVRLDPAMQHQAIQECRHDVGVVGNRCVWHFRVAGESIPYASVEVLNSEAPNGCKLSDDCWRGQVMQTEPASPPVGVRSSAGLGAAAGAGSASVGQLVVNDPEEGAKFDVLKGAKAGQIPANFREGGDSDGAEADSQAAVYVSRVRLDPAMQHQAIQECRHDVGVVGNRCVWHFRVAGESIPYASVEVLNSEAPNGCKLSDGSCGRVAWQKEPASPA